MYILEDCLPIDVFNKIHSKITDRFFPWYYTDSTGLETDKINPLDYSWVHIAFDSGQSLSPVSEILEFALVLGLDKIGKRLDLLHRIRIGLTTGQEKPFRHEPHVDQTYPHESALLYINNSDGKTVFYNKFYNSLDGNVSHNIMREKYTSQITDVDIDKEVEPSANKMVLFNGNQFHSSTKPTTVGRRIVVNYNFTTIAR